MAGREGAVPVPSSKAVSPTLQSSIDHLPRQGGTI